MNVDKRKKRVNHNPGRIHRRVRDPIVVNAGDPNTGMMYVGTDGSGNGDAYIVLAPLGIACPQMSVTAGALSVINTLIHNPKMPWFYNQAKNFERYRVLNATVIFVANVGTTSIGNLSVVTSTDFADYFTRGVSQATTTGGKTVSLAVAGSREQRFPIDVDTQWKKVSSVTIRGDNGSYQTLTPINSMNDLLFSTIDFKITGGPANTNVGNFYIEYDIEFKDPTSFVQNI